MPSVHGGGLHHLSKRKRGSDSIHKYPAKSKAVNIYDKIMIVIALINPLMAIPQILQIYNTKNAVGLSLFSWAGYTIFVVPWLIYGIIHKEKPLIIAFIMSLLFNMVILLGVILYG